MLLKDVICEPKKKKPNGYIYLVLPILFWSIVPSAAKFALKELTHLQILFYNNVIGIVTMLAIIIAQDKTHHFKSYRLKDYAIMFGMGALGLFLYYTCLYGSFSYAPVAQANILNYLWPAFVVIFSIIFHKQRFNHKTLIGIGLSFFGAFIIFTRGDFTSFSNEYTKGYILAFCAAVCTALFSVLGKKLPYERMTSMFVYYVASLVLVTPTMLMHSTFVVPRQMPTVFSLLFLGVCATALGFVFWFKALHNCCTYKMANLVYFNPFFALIFVYFFHKESIPLSAAFGLLFNLAGVFFQISNKVHETSPRTPGDNLFRRPPAPPSLQTFNPGCRLPVPASPRLGLANV
ncbi:MAG: DMT family transporter [Candidatus Omnitrophica bacterium]|nr:DMT family transporter [Candidatus Omnitrophota bacterium]